jgi:glycosyltransferase involved in cell wall biosynthesis/uncharacterized SAM-binding protein YcdF (DUF218 family)
VHHRNVIIIGSIDWDVNPQLNQRLATSFAADGNRVLFIENTGVRSPTFGDAHRIKERLRNWLRGTRGFRDVGPNLTVLSPLLVPLPYSRLAVLVNRWILSRLILKWMKVSHFRAPIVITFLPTPLAQAVARDVEPTLLVYYCANDMAGLWGDTSRVRKWETRLFRDAHLVFVISEALRERAAAVSSSVHWFPDGVDFDKFANARAHAEVPEELRHVPRPIVGYVGALSQVFDQDLIVGLAQQLPEATIALVGPPYADLTRLEACPTVKLLGPRPHDEVPAFVKAFDVALVPYVKAPFTDSVYACKLNEYLAMGVPVVTTDVREMRRFVETHGPVVAIGRDAVDFVEKVREAVADNDENRRLGRIDVAAANSWHHRFAELSAVIERGIEEQNQAPSHWARDLVAAYRRNRARLVWRAAAVALIYAAVFHSPAVWFMGNVLALREPPIAADAIVVFSGNGESAYVNPGYQRRALDALRYFQAGYANALILSSGKEQTIAEVEIMRALLVSKGIPPGAIQVVDQYPSNTRENVQIARDILARRGARSILFVTAPYHSRRAAWIWRKEAPQVRVVTVEVVDTPPATPQWGATADQVKAISYEYAAIAYNWWNGWL